MKITITLGDKGISLEDALTVLHKLSGNASFGVVLADHVNQVAAENKIASASVPPVPIIAFVETTPTVAGEWKVSPAPVEAPTEGVDADGLPWDARIHSSNKKRTAKNVWVARRNVDDATHAAVVTELRAGSVHSTQWAHLGSPDPVVAFANVNSTLIAPPPSLAMSLEVPPPPPAPAPVAAMVPPVPVVAPAPVVTAPPAPVANVTAPKTVNDLVLRIQGLFQTGTGDAAYVTDLQNRVGIAFGLSVNSIMDIASRPDVIEWALATITADGK